MWAILGVGALEALVIPAKAGNGFQRTESIEKAPGGRGNQEGDPRIPLDLVL